MPELPEIATLANYLNKLLINNYIVNLEINKSSRYFKNGIIPGNEYYCDECKILNVGFRGKKLIFILQHPINGIFYLISFLGMEGRWVFTQEKHSGVKMDIKINDTGQIFPLYYDDSRHFGFLKFIATIDEYNDIFKDTGPDWLQGNITYDQFFKTIQSPRLGNKEIGVFLLEQKYFSGIGNYLRAEILFLAKVYPFKQLNLLTSIEIKAIYDAIISIINNSYQNGGLTISTYRLPDNSIGRYKPKIYGRNFTDENFPIIKKSMKDGRTIHYCEAVQLP